MAVGKNVLHAAVVAAFKAGAAWQQVNGRRHSDKLDEDARHYADTGYIKQRDVIP